MIDSNEGTTEYKIIIVMIPTYADKSIYVILHFHL